MPGGYRASLTPSVVNNLALRSRSPGAEQLFVHHGAALGTDEAPTTPIRATIDPEERLELLLRDLRTSRNGLTEREAQRRLVQFGPNLLERRRGRQWPHELTHPLALLLWAAAGLAWVAGILAVAVAIVIVIIVNAAFAFIQEMQAERAVEALARYLPERTRALRDGVPRELAAGELVPGDVVLLGEGDRISADARLLEGALEVDISTLTGESMPVFRSADLHGHERPLRGRWGRGGRIGTHRTPTSPGWGPSGRWVQIQSPRYQGSLGSGAWNRCREAFAALRGMLGGWR